MNQVKIYDGIGQGDSNFKDIVHSRFHAKIFT